MTTNAISETQILETLRQVIDPEIGCNIVDLGLVYSVRIEADNVTVVMTLTTPGCPMHESICFGVQTALLGLEAVHDAEVELVWEPPWNPSMMTDAGRAATGVRNF
jgi:metal-sulfur cluster biosynthetic enzyme